MFFIIDSTDDTPPVISGNVKENVNALDQNSRILLCTSFLKNAQRTGLEILEQQLPLTLQRKYRQIYNTGQSTNTSPPSATTGPNITDYIFVLPGLSNVKNDKIIINNKLEWKDPSSIITEEYCQTRWLGQNEISNTLFNTYKEDGIPTKSQAKKSDLDSIINKTKIYSNSDSLALIFNCSNSDTGSTPV